MEELVALRHRGASDAELLASLCAPSDGDLQPAEPIPLTEEQGRELLDELARRSG